MTGAVCPQPDEDLCVEATPCDTCVSLSRPLSLTVGDEPDGWDDCPDAGSILSGGSA